MLICRICDCKYFQHKAAESAEKGHVYSHRTTSFLKPLYIADEASAVCRCRIVSLRCCITSVFICSCTKHQLTNWAIWSTVIYILQRDTDQRRTKHKSLEPKAPSGVPALSLPSLSDCICKTWIKTNLCEHAGGRSSEALIWCECVTFYSHGDELVLQSLEQKRKTCYHCVHTSLIPNISLPYW